MENAPCTEAMAVDPVSAEGIQEWEMSECEENEESSSETSCKLDCFLCVCVCAYVRIIVWV